MCGPSTLRRSRSAQPFVLIARILARLRRRRESDDAVLNARLRIARVSRLESGRQEPWEVAMRQEGITDPEAE